MQESELKILFLLNQLNQFSSQIDQYEATIDFLKNQNEQLNDAAKLLKIITTHSPDLILRHTPDGEILSTSPSSTGLLGFTPQEMEGKNIYQFIEEEDRDEFENELHNQLESSTVNTVRFRMKHKYNGSVWVESKRKVIQEKNSEVYRETINWISDISERLINEQNLINLLKEYNHKKMALNDLLDHQSMTILRLKSNENDLKKVNHLKDQILSVIAHDLRNPFGTLKNLTKLLIDDSQGLSDNDRRMLGKVIHYTVDKTNSLLENLMTWAIVHANKIQTQIEIVNLYDLISQNFKFYLLDIRRKQLKIICKMNRTVEIRTDPNILATVLRNIIYNAIKFSNNKGVISCSYLEQPESHVIKISDTGTGMSEEDVEKINKSISVKSRHGTFNESGSGLGLMIITELLPRINGTLTVKSKLNVGTTFKIVLPK